MAAIRAGTGALSPLITQEVRAARTRRARRAHVLTAAP